MGLSSLSITTFRNLSSINIKPDKGLNLIVGKNAAGKTSLLEAIFYLSYGRSFRSSQTRDLISYDTEFFRLVSQLNDETLIGLEKALKSQSVRVNRKTVLRISDLSILLPVVVLHPDSHQLITSGPEHRRQFMDWGVFHVEHQFLLSWKKYKKALSQRNAALRLHQSDKLCSLWNNELIEHALIIENHRLSYLNLVTDEINRLARVLFTDSSISLDYRRGWPDDISYDDYLQSSLHKDKEKGFTQSGPHRADIKIKVDGKSAQTSLSRGQQKKLVALLKISQLSLFSKQSNRRCILLYDDLPAELDPSNQDKIMSILSELDIQVFITAIHRDLINCKYWDEYKVFHVEHGQIALE
jgi:DNA replication and repair protein RecF